MNKDSVFVNVVMPIKWKRQLQEMAKRRSNITGFYVTPSDFVRYAIQKKYNLKGDCKHGVKVQTIYVRSIWDDILNQV